jgi:Kef-type K+ transport system membrane component KefB
MTRQQKLGPDTNLTGTGGNRVLRSIALYAATVGGAVLVFLLIDSVGRSLKGPAALSVEPAVAPVGTPNALASVLIALIAVMTTGRLLGLLLRFVGQPPVIGEVVGGILLGPSLLGRIWPAAAGFILPPAVAPYLEVIAQLGVILYMFLVGLELNLATLRKQARATVAISHAGMMIPFLCGAMLALLLYPRYAGERVPFTGFALFLGIATSITAFPVLARILTDRHMQHTPLGVLALGCAAAGDVTAWCLLAFVVGVARSDAGSAFVVLGLTVGFIGFMILVVRPVMVKLVSRFDEPLSPNVAAVVFMALLSSALATQAIGIQALFGAFLLGAVIPTDSAIAKTFARKLEELVTVLLLPAFFALTGMRTRIDLVSGIDQWLVCGLIVVVATAGKFGGTLTAARFTGLGWRDSAALGVLMNTRGLMELVALNIGLDMGILSPALFAMMVIMALVTTVTTIPLLQLLGSASPDRTPGADGSESLRSNQRSDIANI